MLKNSFRRKVISLVAAVSLLSGVLAPAEVALAKTTGHTAHSIPAAQSKDGNPLKGLFPFEDGTNPAFPHSMEWFYISVKEVQTDMNTFDWTALEEHLDAISGRGHQAVFRFYYDYPGLPTGVPQFLIDGGLKMNRYDEPDNLGGSGYSPDYENQNFRNSMQNFIKAFGAKYDGDSRIAFITMGLLGFWGEWHTWPYDGWNPPKENWTPSTAVYTEVLTAFDKAFNKTPLCVREPKDGVPNSTADVGYHDDSFCRETLTVDAGGQSWSFMEKLTAAKEQDKWMTSPVGGEIYPADQATIFSENPWMGGEGQTWDACLAQAHPSWLMCHKIQEYTGETLNNATEASRQLGYDFRVTKAYFDNLSTTNPLYLGIDIKNIGIAPFYYDHTMWPVQVGIKQNGTLVKSWTTTWDLNTISADESIKTFEYTVAAPGLAEGTYNMCIKVVNPLTNGNKLGFANAGQDTDGWLNLGSFTVGKTPEPGTITIDGNSSDWINIPDITSAVGQTATSLKVANDSNYIYVCIQGSNLGMNSQVYIDSDNNPSTGHLEGTWDNSGCDYLIELGRLYRHPDNSSTWSWTDLGASNVTVSANSSVYEARIERSAISNLSNTFCIGFKDVDSGWNTVSRLPAPGNLSSYTLK